MKIEVFHSRVRSPPTPIQSSSRRLRKWTLLWTPGSPSVYNIFKALKPSARQSLSTVDSFLQQETPAGFVLSFKTLHSKVQTVEPHKSNMETSSAKRSK